MPGWSVIPEVGGDFGGKGLVFSISGGIGFGQLDEASPSDDAIIEIYQPSGGLTVRLRAGPRWISGPVRVGLLVGFDWWMNAYFDCGGDSESCYADDGTPYYHYPAGPSGYLEFSLGVEVEGDLLLSH